VDIMINKSQKQPEHMALQPFGKIPVLQDGDFTIFGMRSYSFIVLMNLFDLYRVKPGNL